jgi:glycosyltransferase involved in cell wall biosynthesis
LAYTRKVNQPLPLKVCGISRADACIAPDENTDITFIKYARGTDLNELFSNASAFLFVSTIEGFGFPPLEALLYNIPSVVSDIPVLREVLGDSAVFADPYDTEKIGAGLKLLLEDNTLYNKILDNSKPILDNYTWEKCSLNTVNVFKKLAQT